MAPNTERHIRDDTLSGKEINENYPSHTVPDSYQWRLVWSGVIYNALIQGCAIYGLYLLLTGQMMNYTIIWIAFMFVTSEISITAGAHRLWTHKAYSAKWPLRAILAFFYTTTFQFSIYRWVCNHRKHHKFMDTDADPHNIKRGFFFAHIGWLLIEGHPEVKIKGITIDMSDLEADPIVMFQKRWYWLLATMLAFVLPTWAPIYFWGEDPWVSWFACALRWTIVYNCTALVNSGAHTWGFKPFDKNISPTEGAIVSLLTSGEGWHNFHHTFPWDYKAAELGTYGTNWTTGFIDMLARTGWAYNVRTVSQELIKKRVMRTGDITWLRDQISPDHGQSEDGQNQSDEKVVWGWEDPDFLDEDRQLTETFALRRDE